LANLIVTQQQQNVWHWHWDLREDGMEMEMGWKDGLGHRRQAKWVKGERQGGRENLPLLALPNLSPNLLVPSADAVQFKSELTQFSISSASEDPQTLSGRCMCPLLSSQPHCVVAQKNSWNFFFVKFNLISNFITTDMPKSGLHLFEFVLCVCPLPATFLALIQLPSQLSFPTRSLVKMRIQ
jgi:hypothetical protein